MAAGTRSSARLNSSPQSADKTAGTKRKADDTSPSGNKSKRGRPSKEQKTLEETVQGANEHDENDETEDVGANEAAEGGDANGQGAAGEGFDEKMDDAKADEPAAEKSETAAVDTSSDEQKNAFDEVKADEKDQGTTSKEDESNKKGENEAADVSADAVEEDKKREEAQPSNVLEKGIIYFFTRGRVGIEDPSNVADLQRSYFILRPLPEGAKITDGAIQDVGNNRLVGLPKKVWPKSPKDRFMVSVDKSKTSMSTLKEEFFSGSEYSTKTTGTRHQPEVTPIGEGVYTMVTTGNGSSGTTHLAYMLTIPREMGQLQDDVGIKNRGSFIMSVKNPESSSGNAVQLPQTAEYPKELLEEFKGRAWAPAHPKFLDYDGAAMLLIGENFDTGSTLEPREQDEKDENKETPQDEIEKLEHEDELRVEHLKGDDTVFADLGISSKDYPDVKTTW